MRCFDYHEPATLDEAVMLLQRCEGRASLLAGGTDLLVDGVATGPLGGSGAVRRDLSLDPDQIKDGKLLATSQRPGAQ